MDFFCIILADSQNILDGGTVFQVISCKLGRPGIPCKWLRVRLWGCEGHNSTLCDSLQSESLLHPNLRFLSIRWAKRVICMRASHLFFYNPKEEFFYCVSGLTFSFCNFHHSHLQPVNKSLSILISFGQQLLHCAGLLRNKIDALWHGGLQLQHDGPQTLLLPTEGWKAGRLRCFPNLTVKRVYIFCFRISDHFIVGK